MSLLRISEASQYLGVSDDSVRRWIQAGKLTKHTDDGGRIAVDGVEVAQLVRAASEGHNDPLDGMAVSARNKLQGLVTNVISDKVMSQVEVQCGPFRVKSLISTEAVNELGLEPGKPVVAGIKATNVILTALED